MRSVELHRNPRGRGLTLIELVVVVAILVALAGIVIPLISGMIGRAETSARATNSQEIYKAIQLQNALYTRYPSDWDSLTDGTSTPLPYVGGLTGSGTLPLQVGAITAPQSKALASAGIVRAQLMQSTAPTTTPTDTTFNPYLNATDKSAAAGTVAITSSATPILVTLTNAGQFQLNLTDSASISSGTYVVFGFGKRCSLVGTGVAEAPVNFFDNAALSPDTRYSRYGVVFQVNGVAPNSGAAPKADGSNLVDFSRAKLVRVFRFGGSLGTGDDAIKSYWDDVTTGGGS